ncbi:MAG: aminotransferase class V-fold PLP-dependent enzyme, partial [Gammaproteobacteria bacterium]|nr:aminotransferase class V-fold PLP-dependent enzyme [Gammaproteobacteria bacterium]
NMLASRLQQGVTHIALVHHETTTGKLNHIEAIAELARQYNVSLLLDAVSSFGAEEIKFENWNISACAVTANKCLHGVPGISFVIINRKSIQQSNSRNTLYLDLKTYMQQQDASSTPFTQSIQVLYALDEALDEHAESGGWLSRRDDYRKKMELLNNRLVALNIIPLIKPEDSSCVLVTYHLPENTNYQAFHDYLKDNGFVIYSGQGGLASKVFRISLMGEVSVTDIERLVGLIEGFIEN